MNVLADDIIIIFGRIRRTPREPLPIDVERFFLGLEDRFILKRYPTMSGLLLFLLECIDSIFIEQKEFSSLIRPRMSSIVQLYPHFSPSLSKGEDSIVLCKLNTFAAAGVEYLDTVSFQSFP